MNKKLFDFFDFRLILVEPLECMPLVPFPMHIASTIHQIHANVLFFHSIEFKIAVVNTKITGALLIELEKVSVKFTAWTEGESYSLLFAENILRDRNDLIKRVFLSLHVFSENFSLFRSLLLKKVVKKQVFETNI